MGKEWKERQEQTAKQSFSKWEHSTQNLKEKKICLIVYE